MSTPSPACALTVTEQHNRDDWDTEVLANQGHPLQLWGWGQVKGRGESWRPRRLRIVRSDGSLAGLAQVLVRRLPWPLSALSYVPRGPVVPDPADRGAVMQAVRAWAQVEVGGTGITFEPAWSGTLRALGLPEAVMSPTHILIGQTLQIDLSKTEEELLGEMSKTTRQGVRRSARTELEYRQVHDTEEVRAALAVYRETAERAGFGLYTDEYYERIVTEMGDHAPIFGAFEGDRLVAFLWLAASDHISFELYSGSDDLGRKLRANYSLKWLAITSMKERGLDLYDVNGLLNDAISDFKRSFSRGNETELIGTVDVPFGWRYRAFTTAMPFARDVLRTARRLPTTVSATVSAKIRALRQRPPQ